MINNLKLRTKVMIPIAIIAVVVLAMVSFGAMKLAEVGGAASDIIEHRDLAAVQMVRGARRMTQAASSILGSLVYDSNDPVGRAANEAFQASIDKAIECIDKAIGLSPDKASAIAVFKDRFRVLADQMKRPMQIGRDTPGLAAGSKLKLKDLDAMAEGARLIGTIDAQMRQLINDVVKFDNDWLAENGRAAADLRSNSRKSLFTMIVVGVISTVLAMGLSLWMSAVKITAPLARLVQRMGELAKGDLSVIIEDQERHDEIGVMAQAVQVFKAGGLRLQATEAAALGDRQSAEQARSQRRSACRPPAPAAGGRQVPG